MSIYVKLILKEIDVYNTAKPLFYIRNFDNNSEKSKAEYKKKDVFIEIN